MSDLRSQAAPRFPEGLDVSRETLDRLLVFYEWHQKCRSYGSFAKYGSEEEFWRRHVGNSLRLVPYLSFSDIVLDVGSGGGFPGLVLASMGYQVVLSDIDQKKRFFLAEAARMMGLSSVVVGDSRFCSLGFSVVTARAVTSLVDLFSLVPRVSRETRGLFLKGKSFQKEIEEAKRVVDFTHKAHHYDEGVVLEVVWKTSL